MSGLQTQLFLSRSVGERFDHASINKAHALIVGLLRAISPERLIFHPQDRTDISQAKQMVLMRMALCQKYLHLFTNAGTEASQQAYDNALKCQELLRDFPDLMAAEGFRTIQQTGRLEIECIKSGCRIDLLAESGRDGLSHKMATILRLAIVEHVYHWCVESAGNRPRSYQLNFSSQNRPTMEAASLKRLMSPFIKALGKLNEYSSPEVYFAIKYILTCNATGLPFNISIPY